MAIRIGFFLCALFCSVSLFCSDDLTPFIKYKSFIPPNYYVGDEVALWIRCQGIGASDLKKPENLFKDQWYEILKIDIRQVEPEVFEIEINFRAFKPGLMNLPVINLGRYYIPEVEINTHSIFDIGVKEEIRPPRGQMYFPYTWIRLLLFVFFIIGLPFALFFLGRYLFRYYVRWERYRRLRFPRNKLLRGFKRLRRRMGEIDVREFCIHFVDLFKTYLSERFTSKILNMTTCEVGALLEAEALGRDMIDTIESLLKLADLVKFSGKIIERDEMQVFLDEGEKISLKLEDEALKNVDL
ncbi:MAG: hypothetical protein JXR70_14770 [Spirochaetales bacterium]|nr:hypothetical protein [Spirochaetales bacterium]